MSIARVKTVNRSQKPGTCEKCGTALPVGSAYRWFKVGFRSKHKHVRCMEAKCSPRNSELESSNLAEAYAAQEAAYDDLDAAGTIEDIDQVAQDCSSAAGDVMQQYADSIEAAPMLEDQLQPTIDALEEWVSELDNVDLPEQPTAEEGEGVVCSVHEEDEHDATCEACQAALEEKQEEALEEAREIVRAAIDSLAV